MLNDKDIIERFNKLSNEVGNGKYYHMKSINNFIKYLGEFGSTHYKSKAIDLLNGYFDYVSSNGALTFEDGKYIYYTFIAPLGKIYSWNFKFFIHLDITSIILYIGGLFLLLFLIKVPIFIYLISLIICVVIYLPFHFKKKKSKVYGFNY